MTDFAACVLVELVKVFWREGKVLAEIKRQCWEVDCLEDAAEGGNRAGTESGLNSDI